MRQFKVFLDEEIGMTLKYSNKTIISVFPLKFRRLTKIVTVPKK